MWVVAIIIGGLALLLVLISALSRAMLAAMRGPLEARALRRYRADAILASEYGANSFGLASKGKLQARGNGALLLTANELCFLQVVPEVEIVIPLAAIRSTSFTRTHLGKATPFKLLKIQFDQGGGEDVLAVMVRHPGSFQQAIEEARAGGSGTALQT